jgi:chromosome segregation ATPase
VSVDLKLGLPQVAVVGSQSSGKSSVLEALVSCSGSGAYAHMRASRQRTTAHSPMLAALALAGWP